MRSYRLTHAAFIQLQWPFGQFDIKMFNLMYSKDVEKNISYYLFIHYLSVFGKLPNLRRYRFVTGNFPDARITTWRRVAAAAMITLDVTRGRSA